MNVNHQAAPSLSDRHAELTSLLEKRALQQRLVNYQAELRRDKGDAREGFAASGLCATAAAALFAGPVLAWQHTSGTTAQVAEVAAHIAAPLSGIAVLLSAGIFVEALGERIGASRGYVRDQVKRYEELANLQPGKSVERLIQRTENALHRVVREARRDHPELCTKVNGNETIVQQARALEATMSFALQTQQRAIPSLV